MLKPTVNISIYRDIVISTIEKGAQVNNNNFYNNSNSNQSTYVSDDNS